VIQFVKGSYAKINKLLIGNRNEKNVENLKRISNEIQNISEGK